MPIFQCLGNEQLVDEPNFLSIMTDDIFSSQMTNKIFRCGGSLVNQWHVVTAGHCVARARPNQVSSKLSHSKFQVPWRQGEDGIDYVAVGAGHPGRVRAQVGCGAVAWQNVRGHADQGPPLLQVHAAGNGPEKGQSCHLFPASEQL